MLGGMVFRGEGRERVGIVVGREDEDVEILIDREGQNLSEESLTALGEKYGLSFFVFSEHKSFMVGTGEPDCFLALDPTENSDEYSKNTGTPLYHVAGFWSKDRSSMGAVCINLTDGKIYINLDGFNYELKQEPQGVILIPFPPTPRIETIDDPNFIWASYVGKHKYKKFVDENLETLDEHRHQHSSFHGKGGSHIYAHAAQNGTAYIMGHEPVAEIAPGYAFVKSADFTIANVSEDGTYAPVRFDPQYYYKNPDAYKTDRISFLVVAPTPSLANEIIHEAFSKRLPGF